MEANRSLHLQADGESIGREGVKTDGALGAVGVMIAPKYTN